MARPKIIIALLGTLIPLVVAKFPFDEHFKTFGINDDRSNGRKPWFTGNYASSDPDISESRVVVSHFADSPFFFDNLKHGTDPIPSVIASGVKKIPKEDKALKKAISSFRTIPDIGDTKFEEIIRKSDAPYCQEIITKDTKTDSSNSNHKKMTCYRCKDPKNGSIYEQCSYTSQPKLTLRGPRSNATAEKSLDSFTAASQYPSSKRSPQSDKLPSTYRFSEDYFHSEATHELPAEYEKNVDNCDRIVKDSMICMVCKDPKTNGKYEQCSYVAQPNEKAYAYSKSSSFGGAKTKPRERALKEVIKKAKKPSEHREEEERKDEIDRTHYRHEKPEEQSDHETVQESQEDKEGDGSHYVPDHTYHYPNYESYQGNYGSYEAEGEEEDAAPTEHVKSKSNCKTVQKDGQSCKVCTNPKTGGKSESCNYSYEPKDKAYKYTKSKSFGYPESKISSGGNLQGKSKDREKTAESLEKQDQENSGEDYSSYASEPSTLDYIRLESEKISKKVKEEGDCRKVRKDSMICTICKNQKTGGDFEQCNYSYEPDDKVYAYSKSKSVGSPTKSSSDDDYSESEEHPEETYDSPAFYSTSPLDYIPKTSESQLSNVYTTKKPQEESEGRVDSGFYDATIRRAEIEKIVKNMEKEDRSKCQKMFRGGMSCYKCTDDKGFTNEECVFVTDPNFDSTKKKPVQATEAATAIEVTANSTNRTTLTTTPATKLLEPLTSASWKSIIAKRKTRETKEKAKNKDEELEVLDEELEEAEPYDYVAETRPIYDKVLGLTLPAYMLEKSPHEIEFDEIVEKSKF